MKSKTIVWSKTNALWLSSFCLLLGITVYGILLVLGWMRDHHALIGAFDTGLYLELWNSLMRDGRLASDLVHEQNFLAHHFQPVLYLFYVIGFLPKTSFTLFVIAALFAISGIVILYWYFRPKYSGAESFVFSAVLLNLAIQPAVLDKIWNVFNADILAWPACCYAAAFIAWPKPEKKYWYAWYTSLLWMILCKEFYILVAAAALAALTLRFQSQKFSRATIIRLALSSLVCVGLFCFLFFYWMPANSYYEEYYGLKYLTNPEGRGNSFSLLRFESLFFILFLMGFLPLIGWSATLVASIPTVAMIVLSHSPVTHHPANHYLLAALPFFAASSLSSVKFQHLMIKIRPWFSLVFIFSVLIVTTGYYSFFYGGGPKDAYRFMQSSPEASAFYEDVQIADALIPQGAQVYTDLNLQPLLAHRPRVNLVYNFLGNPYRVDFNVQTQDYYVLTSLPFQSPTPCKSLQLENQMFGLELEQMLVLCEKVKARGLVLSDKTKLAKLYKVPL